jgi:hypothetical protein
MGPRSRGTPAIPPLKVLSMAQKKIFPALDWHLTTVATRSHLEMGLAMLDQLCATPPPSGKRPREATCRAFEAVQSHGFSKHNPMTGQIRWDYLRIVGED